MKYFVMIDKNVAAIFQLQWKIVNISDMFLQHSVLCGMRLGPLTKSKVQARATLNCKIHTFVGTYSRYKWQNLACVAAARTVKRTHGWSNSSVYLCTLRASERAHQEAYKLTAACSGVCARGATAFSSSFPRSPPPSRSFPVQPIGRGFASVVVKAVVPGLMVW